MTVSEHFVTSIQAREVKALGRSGFVRDLIVTTQFADEPANKNVIKLYADTAEALEIREVEND